MNLVKLNFYLLEAARLLCHRYYLGRSKPGKESGAEGGKSSGGLTAGSGGGSGGGNESITRPVP